MPIGLGTILGGAALGSVFKGTGIGDILGGIFGGSQPTPPPVNPFVQGGVQFQQGISPQTIFYGILVIALTVIIGIFATRPKGRRR